MVQGPTMQTLPPIQHYEIHGQVVEGSRVRRVRTSSPTWRRGSVRRERERGERTVTG